MRNLSLTLALAAALTAHAQTHVWRFSFDAKPGLDQAACKALAKTNSHGSPYLSSFVQTATALVFIIIAIVANADPVAIVFFWGSGVSIVALVALYCLTSVAILVYFRKNRDEHMGAWKTFIAPLLSGLLMLYALYLIVTNFELLVGTDKSEALLLAGTALLAFLLGLVLYAIRRRNLSPEALADLAEEVM